MPNSISQRFKFLRDQRGLSQDDISRALGFKDRQTVSAIETGERRLSAVELVKASDVFAVNLDYFTDPFLLVGEGKFSWRQKDVPVRALAAYEQDAGRMIAAFRTLAPQVGEDLPLLRRALGLSKLSTYEEASDAGERLAAEYQLGEAPALRLATVMERELGILVLMVDPIDGISGAACRLPELDVVLINRREVPGRRHFDLAHELFHILTWDAMPPEHIEETTPTKRNRVEQLADNFASAVLMPYTVLKEKAHWSKLKLDDLVDHLNGVAIELGVSTSALRWRLVHLGLIDKRLAESIREERLRYNGHVNAVPEAPPLLFSKPFMHVIAKALDEGQVTVRRISSILGMTIDDLADLFNSHGVDTPYEL
ncbi:ImmA/IrrE family metallo-endopeptidase [Rhizobium leguminosarum]|uniref:helix-turn-helix domain-containing protein n=1 Tax=Rhizobium leguminosarum TaxID=384 RepID=UPI00102FAB51|nr:XRE family transcriptional regulator [Rhizobium leguminosarum]TBH59771.1 ImmA/IrrE family metallo-endopeptidase [Rhizobium leguminosarum]